MGVVIYELTVFYTSKSVVVSRKTGKALITFRPKMHLKILFLKNNLLIWFIPFEAPFFLIASPPVVTNCPSEILLRYAEAGLTVYLRLVNSARTS
jgi:hypothetical protein